MSGFDRNFNGIPRVLVIEASCTVSSFNAAKACSSLKYGSAKPILEMINILKNYFPDVIVKHKPRDSLTPIRGTLSIKKAQKLINYSPSWPLEKGYPEYIKWYKSIFS